MRPIELSSGGITNTVFADGTRVKVKKLQRPSVTPGSTAYHEAAHVVAAGRIRWATIIPDGGALGATAPEIMTPAAAAAAGALGHDGTGWDQFLTERLLGVSWEGAKAEAHARLSGQGDLIEEVAIALETHGTIGQQQVDEARERVRRDRNGVHQVEVTLTTAEGEARHFTAESDRGVVLIEGVETPIVPFVDKAHTSLYNGLSAEREPNTPDNK